MPYKFLEHTADIKIQADGKNCDEAFKNSAFALREVMLDFEKLKINAKKNRLIGVEGKDLGDLLYNFLEEFLFLHDAENFILSEIEDLEISEVEKPGAKSRTSKINKSKNKNKENVEKYFCLSAKILGDDASSYKFVNKVKAITFNDMKIQVDKTGKTSILFVLDV